jgi:hypothetical protein
VNLSDQILSIFIEIREHWNFADFRRLFSKWRLFALKFFGQNILPTLFNIYAKSCGNPFWQFPI